MAKENKKENEDQPIADRLKEVQIVDELQESYVDYAMSVIVSRAIPDIRDGLKPVQRRILWAMWEENLKSSAKFRKSANVVGAVLGRYHPHGDSAVYDAMIRMAQDFSMRYMLVHGQGNLGCFTGDTQIKLADGRSLSFKELVKESKEGKKNYTFTFNHGTGEIEIAEVKNPRKTGNSAKLVKIALDNGRELKCTPDHKFMLRNGKYREAQDLEPGDSLMPGYTRPSNKNDDPEVVNYPMIQQPRSGKWSFIHHLSDKWNLENGGYKKSAGRVRHHKDFEIVEKAKTYNHTVKSVEFVEEKRDVYDITIDNTHNFLLDAGIFVHNSVDGDSQAAMRYTEAKLSKISEELLVNIEKDTVDWESNYDGTRKEPKYLPAKLPEFLLNGTIGIAVGMATSVAPHNLGEVIDAIAHLINYPDATVKDLMKHIPGPDFPTGGLIYEAEDLERAYSTGRGSVTIQASTDIEERKNHMTIVINEIPFQVNKALLVEKIANLVQEKKIEGIKDVRDESGRDGMRIAIDLKQGVAPERILNHLFKNTELRRKFHFNMVALVDGLQPRTVSLKDILSAYIEHRKVTITRRVKYDLKKAEERAHILEGLVIALQDIDRVIAIIKKSKDRAEAHKNLIRKFKLTPIQADAILDMKLQSLAALESKKIKDELEEKKKEIKEYKAILKSEKRILEIITDELAEMKEEYGDERRTRIIKEELKEFSDEDFIMEKETVIFLTSDGYIKRMPPESFKTQGRGGRGLHGFNLKEKDKVSKLLIANTHDSVLFFTDSGKVFKTKVYNIPAASRTTKGKLVHTFLGLSDNDRVTTFLTYDEKNKDVRNKFFVMATENGVVKKTAVPEFDNVRSTGIIAINLKDDDTLKWARISTGKDSFVFATRDGQSIKFSEKEVRPMGRSTSGVEAIKLKKDDKVTGFVVVSGGEKGKKLLVITENGYGKQTPIEKYKTQRRGGRGIATVKVTKKTGPLAAIRLVDKDIKEVIAFSAKGLIIKTELKDIRTASRATQGVRIMRLDDDDSVVGVVCL